MPARVPGYTSHPPDRANLSFACPSLEPITRRETYFLRHSTIDQHKWDEKQQPRPPGQLCVDDAVTRVRRAQDQCAKTVAQWSIFAGKGHPLVLPFKQVQQCARFVPHEADDLDASVLTTWLVKVLPVASHSMHPPNYAWYIGIAMNAGVAQGLTRPLWHQTDGWARPDRPSVRR